MMISKNTPTETDQTSIVPQIYAEKMHAARNARSMQGERRVVTILFCDVAGSTELASNLDPELWAEIMHEAFDYLVAPIYRYEGTVGRLMGDAVLAFFGAPIAHEDDAERAVRAGLEILTGIQPFAEEIKEEFKADFNVRVGINTGPVVVGEIGADLAMEYTAMGDAANIAARMEQTASPGSVQISEDTYRRVAPIFEFKELGPVDLKGKSEPVTAYQVLHAKARPGSLRGIEGLAAPLIGRAEEFQRFQAAVTDLETGHGAILTLLGEAGLGKSRLLEEVSKWAHERQDTRSEWLFASGVSYNMSLPFGVFRRMLRSLIGVEESSPPEKTVQKIDEFVDRFPQAQQDRNRMALKLILGLGLDEDQLAMDAESRKREVFDAMSDVIRWFGQQAPIVIVLDDLHWADPVSVELISHLFSLTDEMAVLYICSLRPHRSAPGWQVKLNGETNFPHRYTEIHLKPLDREDSKRLIDEILTVSNLPQHLREMIQSKAEGNPFFVEEVIRMLIEQDILKRDESGEEWVARKEPQEVIIPDNLNALLTARIDRLPAEARTTLQYAAVIGRSFHQPVLEKVRSLNGKLQQHLSVLQRYELIREVTRVPDPEYIFTHELTRDAAYSTLLKRQRRRYHRRVGEVLEELFSDREEEFAGRLGYHFEHAGQPDKALSYYISAGDQAASLYANGEAIEYYGRAIEMIPIADVGERYWVDLLLKLGRVFEVSGRWIEAVNLYRQIEQEGQKRKDPDLELEGLLPQVTIYSVPTDLRDGDTGVDLAERALEIAESLDNPQAAAKTLWNMLLLHFYTGMEYEKGVEYGERALEIARQHNIHDLLPFILNDLARAYSSNHQFAEARAAQHEAEEIWRSEGNLPMLADNLTTAADMHYGKGELEEAAKLADEALEISKQIGNLWGQAYSMMVYGGTKVECGLITEGIEMIKECERIGREGNFVAARMFPPLYIAWTYSWVGATELALEHVERSIDALEGFPAFLARANIVKAKIYAIRGELGKAYELVNDSLEQLEIVVPDLFATALTWVIVGEILQQRGELNEASNIVQKLEKFAERSGGLWCMSDVYLLKARLMFAADDPEQGIENLHEARRESKRTGSKRSQLHVLSTCVEFLASSWEKHEAEEVALEARSVINEIRAQIESKSLVECFMGSAQVTRLQSWLSEFNGLEI